VITPSHRANAAVDRRSLVRRLASAIVLVPIVLAIAYLGGWPFLFLCLLGAGGILWEWTRLVAGGPDYPILALGWASLLAAWTFTGVDKPGLAVTALLIGAALSSVAATMRLPTRSAVWVAGGMIYAGVAFLGPALLRRDPELGFPAFLFLAATVWMTDTLAYLVGRAVGGPLLWPQVSPNKTWAGVVGGLAGGVAGGTFVAYANGLGGFAVVGIIALVLSAAAEAGDLFESAVKRRFGVKDTSQLIPGHGGLMDRLDGFLVAASAALLIGIFHQGTDAPARGLLVW
jgi:phosphatidate cytidylyltransferase